MTQQLEGDNTRGRVEYLPGDIDWTLFIPQIPENERSSTVVILGSFGKYFDQINAAIIAFEREGIRVLAPQLSIKDGNIRGFDLLATDQKKLELYEKRYGHPFPNHLIPAFLERIFMHTIDQAGFVYIVCPHGLTAEDGTALPSGYFGNIVTREVGRAMALNKPIFASAPVDPTLDEQDGVEFPLHHRAIAEAIPVRTPDEIAVMAKADKFDTSRMWWIEK